MVVSNNAALICDFAETYHVYDYRSLPLKTAAILAVGLREDSRIKLELSGQKWPMNTILTGLIADRLGSLMWGMSGSRRKDKPRSIVEMLLDTGGTKDLQSFSSPEEFEQRRQEILSKVQNG